LFKLKNNFLKVAEDLVIENCIDKCFKKFFRFVFLLENQKNFLKRVK